MVTTMGADRDRRRQTRAEKLAMVEEQIADGSLRIRHATTAEREAWAAQQTPPDSDPDNGEHRASS
jgi:hypothetical protein